MKVALAPATICQPRCNAKAAVAADCPLWLVAPLDRSGGVWGEEGGECYGGLGGGECMW